MTKGFKAWCIVMVIAYTLIISLMFTSCSISNRVHRHVSKAKKHINKAVILDPSIKIHSDTLIINTVSTKIDTIFNKEDSLIYIQITTIITDTIYIPSEKYDFSNVMTNSQRRQIEHTKRVESRTKRVKIRQTARIERKGIKGSVFWAAIGRVFWIFLIVGVLIYWFISTRFLR